MSRPGRIGGSEARITPKVARLVDAVLSGQAKNLADAGRIAGLAERSCYAAVRRPHVQRHIEEQVRQRFGTIGLLRAAAKMELLLDCDSSYVSQELAKFILGVAGVKPQSDATATASAGIQLNIVLRGDHGDRVIAINGEAQRVDTEPAAVEYRPTPPLLDDDRRDAEPVPATTREGAE